MRSASLASDCLGFGARFSHVNNDSAIGIYSMIRQSREFPYIAT